MRIAMIKKGLLIAALLMGTSLVPVHAADMNKVLRVAYPAPEVGFDPVKTTDLYSSSISSNIFETLVVYDYLSRPLKLIPNTIEAMPEISADGKVYTFHIRKGIYFADDPAFKGKKRELTAEDYAYSLKRLVDPAVHSPTGYLIEDVVEGLHDYVKSLNGKALDYDKPLPGLRALDRYTLQIRLKEPNTSFIYVVAMSHLAAVAREVIEANAANTMAHPVGTGPYRLVEWKPGNKIVLEANPNFRDYTLPTEGSGKGLDARIAADLKGKKLPLVGRVEVSIIEEEQPRLLSFANQQLDYIYVPFSAANTVLQPDPEHPGESRLLKKWADKGVKLQQELAPEINYTYFNMKDPVIGGEGKQHTALRRAIGMAYNVERVIRDIRKGQAKRMQNIIPRDFLGNDPNFQGSLPYDPALANALLDEAGYKIGADGFRTNPDGSRLELELASTPTANDRMFDEAWQDAFDHVKIHLKFKIAKWNELYKSATEGRLQMWDSAWTADYPGADNFLQLLYGPNSGQTNNGNFQNKEYDDLYRKSLSMTDGPERNAIYLRMNKIVAGLTPWVFQDARVYSYVSNSYVYGYKQHPIYYSPFLFIDIRK
jgi:oligopeptide transport system substrate-binding protein